MGSRRHVLPFALFLMSFAADSCKQARCVNALAKGKKRKAFRRQFNEKPSITPSCLGDALATPCISSRSTLVQVNLGSTSDAVESVANVTDIHEAMFFHADDEAVTRSNFGIWSLRWSPDGKEIIAGTGDSSLYLYDVEQQKVGLSSHQSCWWHCITHSSSFSCSAYHT